MADGTVILVGKSVVRTLSRVRPPRVKEFDCLSQSFWGRLHNGGARRSDGYYIMSAITAALFGPYRLAFRRPIGNFQKDYKGGFQFSEWIPK